MEDCQFPDRIFMFVLFKSKLNGPVFFETGPKKSEKKTDVFKKRAHQTCNQIMAYGYHSLDTFFSENGLCSILALFGAQLPQQSLHEETNVTRCWNDSPSMDQVPIPFRRVVKWINCCLAENEDHPG